MFNEFWKYLMFLFFAFAIMLILAIGQGCQNVKQKVTTDKFNEAGTIVIERSVTETEKDGMIDWSSGLNKTLVSIKLLNLQ